MRVLLSKLDEEQSIRQAGYKDAILSYGKLDGDAVVIDPKTYLDTRAQFIQTMPSLVRRVKSLANAARDVVHAARTGKPVMADNDTILKRQAICNKCPHFTGVRCGLCGCFMSVKVQLATSKCPDKPPRW